MKLIIHVIQHLHDLIKDNEEKAKPIIIARLNEVLNLLYTIDSNDVDGEAEKD